MRKKWWPVPLLLVAGYAVVSLAGAIISRRVERTEILDGWLVIRPPHEVSALAEQGDVIWVGGKDGLFALDSRTGNLLEEPAGAPPFRYVRALLVDSGNNLWLGHHKGVTCYDGAAFFNYGIQDGLPHERVTSLLQDREGRIWAGTFNGAVYFEQGRWNTVTAADGLLVDMVNVMLQDRRGGFWFGSYTAPRGGLSYLYAGKWQYFTTTEGLPHNNINALLEDGDGAIWVGTGFIDRGGAVKIVFGEEGERKIDTVLGKESGLPGAKVRSIFQDRSGSLWFGSEYDGIALAAGESWRIFTVRQGLSDNEVKVVLQDAGGSLWLGTHDGVTRIDAAALRRLVNKD